MGCALRPRRSPELTDGEPPRKRQLISELQAVSNKQCPKLSVDKQSGLLRLAFETREQIYLMLFDQSDAEGQRLSPIVTVYDKNPSFTVNGWRNELTAEECPEAWPEGDYSDHEILDIQKECEHHVYSDACRDPNLFPRALALATNTTAITRVCKLFHAETAGMGFQLYGVRLNVVTGIELFPNRFIPMVGTSNIRAHLRYLEIYLRDEVDLSEKLEQIVDLISINLPALRTLKLEYRSNNTHFLVERSCEQLLADREVGEAPDSAQDRQWWTDSILEESGFRELYDALSEGIEDK